MPIYEYECLACQKSFQILIMNKDEEKAILCPSCRSPKWKKLISRVIYHTAEQDRLDAFDPNAPKGDSFFKDTRNIGLHAKKRARQMGVDLGKGFEDKLEKLRTDPGSVIRDSE